MTIHKTRASKGDQPKLKLSKLGGGWGHNKLSTVPDSFTGCLPVHQIAGKTPRREASNLGITPNCGITSKRGREIGSARDDFLGAASHLESVGLKNSSPGFRLAGANLCVQPSKASWPAQKDT